MTWLACIVGAYLIGSIPFGVYIGRARGIDIRQHGSKNIGATNVGRVLGKKFGVLCFALDFLKGAGPVIGAGLLNHTLGREVQDLSIAQLCGWLGVVAATVIGHMFSIFLRFGGGKGVATGLGAMLAMWQVLTFPAMGAIVVWYAALRMFKYVALASMLAVASLPLFYLLTIIPHDAMQKPGSYTLQRLAHGWPPLAGTALIAALVIYRHRGNIARMRRGEEPRAWEQKQDD
jgi:acyl phosphate:glycerol-3-phosphate acyltransferase